jgi:hypothetical protein
MPYQEGYELHVHIAVTMAWTTLIVPKIHPSPLLSLHSNLPSMMLFPTEGSDLFFFIYKKN